LIPWKIKYFLIAVILSLTFSLKLNAQGLQLKVHVPADSVRIDSLHTINNKDYHLKLKLPASIFEVTKDSLKEIKHNPFLPGSAKNGNLLPKINIPPQPKIKSPLDSTGMKTRSIKQGKKK